MTSRNLPFTVSRRGLLQAAALAGGWFVAGASGPGPRAADAAPAAELIVHSELPFNAEPHVARLVEKWITPEPLFYVRNHGNVPEIDPQAFRLEIAGLVNRPASLSLAELRERFPTTTVTATMTCAGNRRDEFAQTPGGKVPGVQWKNAAIGNAEWSGVRLSDVLRHCGLKPEAKHVWFEGLDECRDGDRTFPFGASIPLDKALAAKDQLPGCLLTDRMNGQPLTARHGAPLRGVVPGYIGARSVKWLAKIVVADRPSPNHYVADVYKMVTESTPEILAQKQPIYEFVRNSVIASVGRDNRGRVVVRGYALAAGNGANRLTAVELSAGDNRWHKAEFADPPRPGCWALWTATLDLPAGTQRLRVRASDTLGTQPEKAEWNSKGYQYNGWHAVDLPPA